MSADPRDDFGIFEGHERMFFYLDDPLAMIREETERMLRQQVPDTALDRIRCFGDPKWLTLGRKQPDDPEKVVVGHYAFCFRCELSVRTPEHEERLDTLLTFMFCDIDRPGEDRSRISMDVHGDADAGFDEAAFQARFMEFRGEAD